MNKLLILSFLILISLSAWAQKKAQLTVIDPGIDASSLKENFEVHQGSTHKSALPTKLERDMFFGSLMTKMKSWDELQKDIFYMDLKKKSLSDLQKKYPEFKVAELKDLKGRR